MRMSRILLLLVALIAGGLAAYLATRGGGEAPTDPGAPPTVVEEARTQVLVAIAPIGVGQRLSETNMEGDVIVTQDVFLYDILGEDSNGNLLGQHRSTGITKPQFTERAKYFNEEANLVEALEKSNLEQHNLLNN